jgi:hypothetical protein
MSYSEVKNLPIKYRHWFLKRLVQDFEKKNETNDQNKSKTSDIDMLNRFEKNMFKSSKSR